MRFVCELLLAIVVMFSIKIMAQLTKGADTLDHTMLYVLCAVVSLLVSWEFLRNVKFK